MRYFITFSYDGSKYKGYQKQPNERTIQGELESILTKINSNKEVYVSASGRTDAGVHAINQKAHFDLNSDIEESRLKNSLNKLLPKDIYVKTIEKVSNDFHARFDVISKEYIYKVNLGEYNPIECDYVYQYNKDLDIESMKQALCFFEGTHNFKSFTKVDEEKENYNRTIIKTNISVSDDNILTISLLGTGFMRYMVRNIVGLLIEIGEGKRKSEDVIEILKKEDRTKAGKTAPSSGLYLKNVFY